jgi:hypothetical protein
MNLSDEQWCVLDVLMRAREKGVVKISRDELLANQTLPQGVLIKLTWAALTMPKELLQWHPGERDFSITGAGAQLYNLRFGNGSNPVPTTIADTVICLHGPDKFGAMQ